MEERYKELRATIYSTKEEKKRFRQVRIDVFMQEVTGARKHAVFYLGCSLANMSRRP